MNEYVHYCMDRSLVKNVALQVTAEKMFVQSHRQLAPGTEKIFLISSTNSDSSFIRRGMVTKTYPRKGFDVHFSEDRGTRPLNPWRTNNRPCLDDDSDFPADPWAEPENEPINLKSLFGSRLFFPLITSFFFGFFSTLLLLCWSINPPLEPSNDTVEDNPTSKNEPDRKRTPSLAMAFPLPSFQPTANRTIKHPKFFQQKHGWTMQLTLGSSQKFLWAKKNKPHRLEFIVFHSRYHGPNRILNNLPPFVSSMKLKTRGHLTICQLVFKNDRMPHYTAPKKKNGQLIMTFDYKSPR